MNCVLFAPHNDDEALFASYTILRYKPVVYIVTRSVKQEERHIRYTVRNAETIKAMEILKAEVVFLDIPEPELTENILIEKFSGINCNVVFAPALQGGHQHHDIVSRASDMFFKDKVIHYATYTKQDLTPLGNIELVPREKEAGLKNLALDCYKSQLPWNQRHFDAVRNKSEYWIE